MPSNLYWFTGLSGAGKTTIANLFYSSLKVSKKDLVFLDGDTLRQIFDDKQKYTLASRKRLAMRYSKLCKMLIEQNIDVVIATISMFQDVRDWNRGNIENYHEIYIKVPIDILIKRDQKNLYSRALNGEISNVLGIDIDFEEPDRPDITILNDGSMTPENIVNHIRRKIILNP
jgi:cytidine diphosphoramidate kinase